MKKPAIELQPSVPTSDDTPQEMGGTQPNLVIYLFLGVGLGIVFTKAEMISWFRMQEMFRFQSIHMYGIIGSAVLVAGVSVFLIKKFGVRTFGGDAIEMPHRELGRWGSRYWLGGSLFGLGWALLGACPGPIFALIGNGITVVVAALASGLAGTWFYGLVRDYLPHD